MSTNQSNKKRRLWIVIAIIAVIGIYVGQFFLPVSEKHFRDGDIAFRGTNPELLLFTGSLYTPTAAFCIKKMVLGTFMRRMTE